MVFLFAGSSGKLQDAISAAQASHPDIKGVRHPDSAAFEIVAIPDSMGAQADCSRIKPGEELNLATADNSPVTYGQYYATGFHMTKSVDEPPVLWLVWARENGQWKIVAYHILSP